MISSAAKQDGAKFQPLYHPGVWIKSIGQHNCCGDLNQFSQGCQQSTSAQTSQVGKIM